MDSTFSLRVLSRHAQTTYPGILAGSTIDFLNIPRTQTPQYVVLP